MQTVYDRSIDRQLLLLPLITFTFASSSPVQFCAVSVRPPPRPSLPRVGVDGVGGGITSSGAGTSSFFLSPSLTRRHWCPHVSGNASSITNQAPVWCPLPQPHVHDVQQTLARELRSCGKWAHAPASLAQTEPGWHTQQRTPVNQSVNNHPAATLIITTVPLQLQRMPFLGGTVSAFRRSFNCLTNPLSTSHAQTTPPVCNCSTNEQIKPPLKHPTQAPELSQEDWLGRIHVVLSMQETKPDRPAMLLVFSSTSNSTTLASIRA